jgi:diguanylate cyclase (GGDEF)-like protein
MLLKQIGTFGAYGTSIDNLQLFQGETDPEVATMLASCPVMSVARGERIDDVSRERLFIVLSGQLEVGADAHNGDEGGGGLILPGESAGEQAVFDDAVELATMTAVEDSELLVIESSTVWALVERSHVLSRNLLRLLSFRIRAANALARRRQKLGNFYRQLSLNDALTGLYNRAWLNDMLPKLAARAAQDGGALSLVMVDLDHFKRFNDTHGHVAGDGALAAAANVLRSGLRPSDFAVRYGGEEMMVLLPGTTLDQAVLVAQRLCERLREAIVFADMSLPLPHVTGSFGVASLAPGSDERALMEAADAALYRAKGAGRNCVST